MITVKHPSRPRIYKTPWYDNNCFQAKKEVKKSFVKLLSSNYDETMMKEYNEKKKSFKFVSENTKQLHKENLILKIRESKNVKEFWITVNKFSKKTPKYKLEVSIDDCVTYFKNIYNPTPRINIISLTNTHAILDKPITLTEVQTALAHLKNDKAPGPDGIPNECYKNLPPNWTHYLQNMFNTFLIEENVPVIWSNSLLKLMYKKGDAKNPENYRPIALENTGLKAFIFIIQKRLYDLSENLQLLPEEQCGFREKRSCVDNIFIAKSLIDIQLEVNKKQLLAIVVDYKKAFDTVPHNKMFQKLDNLGINGKFIRTVAKMYDQASISLVVNDKTSDKIKITKGEIQGDVLSPLFYALYTSDMPSHFRANGHKGIKLNDEEEILMITFADDTLIFANSAVDCQDKLKELENYCERNDLEVNPSKTNVMRFFKGRPSKLRPIYYKGTMINYVNSVKYLGVTFSSSGKFLIHANETIKKAHLAAGKVLSILIASKSDSWDTKCTLFDTLAKSILMYGSEVGTLDYGKQIEIVESRFFKRLLHLPLNTPNYMLRNKLSRLPMEFSVVKCMYEWWRKILDMPKDRFPRKCYEALRTYIPNNLIRNNWKESVKELLTEANMSEVWILQSTEIAKREKNFSRYLFCYL